MLRRALPSPRGKEIPIHLHIPLPAPEDSAILLGWWQKARKSSLSSTMFLGNSFMASVSKASCEFPCHRSPRDSSFVSAPCVCPGAEHGYAFKCISCPTRNRTGRNIVKPNFYSYFLARMLTGWALITWIIFRLPGEVRGLTLLQLARVQALCEGQGPSFASPSLFWK